MRKLLAIIGLAVLVSIELKAQSNLLDTAESFFSASSTNWYVGAGMLYDYDLQKVGGRVGLAYSLLDGITTPELALEYFNGSFYVVSGTLQLRPPQKWLGKFPVRPFAEVGAKLPISGLGNQNGDPIAFTGAGVTARISKHFLLLGAAEYRLNGDHKGVQVLFGPVYQF